MMSTVQPSTSPTMASVTERTAPDPPAAPRSPLEAALERVGDRWSLLLVDALLAGGRRFGELREELPGLAPNILTERLRRLEREGIVIRDALLDASAADGVLADRRRSRPGVSAALARRLGLATQRARGAPDGTIAAGRPSKPAGIARPAPPRSATRRRAVARRGSSDLSESARGTSSPCRSLQMSRGSWAATSGPGDTCTCNQLRVRCLQLQLYGGA